MTSIASHVRIVFVAALAVLLPAPLYAQSPAPLPWEHDWKSACARAAAEKRPLLVVVMKDHEPGCERMLDKVYGDAEVRLHLANYILVPVSTGTHPLIEVEQGGQRVPSCPQFVGALCSEHQAIERELHAKLAEPGGDEVLAPQHLVFDAKGEVVLRRPYEMRRQGLLEFLERGLALANDPAGAAQLGVKSAVVQRLEDSILKAREEAARTQATRDLLEESSPDREIAFLDAVDKASGAAGKEPIVRAAGSPEYKVWAPIVAKLLDSKEPWVRGCAVVSLEEIADPASGPALLALWEREKEPETRKDLLRALGPCGGGRPEVKKLLLEQLEAPKDPLRVAAAMSLGFFLKGDAEIAAALEKRYPKEKATTNRLALLFAFYESGDTTLRDRVDAMTKAEKDVDLLSFVGIVRKKLSGEGSGPPSGAPSAGPGGGAPANPPKGPPGGSGGTGAPPGTPPAASSNSTNFGQLRKLLAPLYDDDKIVRNAIKLAKKWSKGGKGGP
jgi:hypothetical protein